MSKYCKKCEREIPQNSKTDTCENCQIKGNVKIRRIFEVVGGILSFGLYVYFKNKFGGPRV